MLAFPLAAGVACWLNAWIMGREPADEVIAGVVGESVSVLFRPGEGADLLPPALVLGRLRSQGVRRVSLCLPRPGSPLGLGGPPEFNADAVEAGEAIIWHGPNVGFVPEAGAGRLTWHGSTADPPTYLPDVASADRELREALVSTARMLADLDVAAWNPDVADELMNLRSPLPRRPRVPFVSPQAASLAATAGRCAVIVDLAGRDDGGAISAAESASRRHALVPLECAARSALVAACSAVD